MAGRATSPDPADPAAPAIGGYHGLELGPPQPELYPTALRFQSARGALTALLRQVRPSRLWLPNLVCNVVADAAAAAGVEVRHYPLRSSGTPDVKPGGKEVVLVVDYFGVSGAMTRAAIDELGGDRVILDHAQALFTPPGDCLGTVYSPRKFVGIPDGGLLATRLDVPLPQDVDDGSVARCLPLLRRLDAGPEAGYAEFLAADRSLGDCTPRRMSALTEAMWRSVDLARVRRRRERNFKALHEALESANSWPFAWPHAPVAPLCYPFLRQLPRDDPRMNANRFYVPTYWPGNATRCLPGSLERSWLDNLLPLPVDQRYDVDDAYHRRMRDAGVLPA